MTETNGPDGLGPFVERMGLIWEDFGLPRIAGRIFGALVCAPEPLSLDQLAGSLGVSRASISTDARRLAELGLLDRVARPGDRRDFYAIASDAPARAAELQLDGIRRFQSAYETIRGREDLDPGVAARLDRFARAHGRIAAALEVLLDDLRRGSDDPRDATRAA